MTENKQNTNSIKQTMKETTEFLKGIVKLMDLVLPLNYNA